MQEKEVVPGGKRPRAEDAQTARLTPAVLDLFENVVGGSGYYSGKCKYCGYQANHCRLSELEHHLACNSGYGIRACSCVPASVKKEFQQGKSDSKAKSPTLSFGGQSSLKAA
jgi:hypothetical protein